MTLPPPIEYVKTSGHHHDDHERERGSRNDECRHQGTIEDDEHEHHNRRAHDTDAQHPIHKGSVRGVSANTLPRSVKR